MHVTVNIPRSVLDPFYRYKMPTLMVKIEGKGNGVRTVIVNMGQIMDALHRPLAHGTKFIGFEVGADTKVDDQQHACMIRGQHDVDKLATCLDKYIAMYVLCNKCRNPETGLNIKNKLTTTCKACGNHTKVKDHPLSNYIIKSNNKPKTIKKDKLPKPHVNHDNVDEQWSLEVTSDAIASRRQELICHNIENNNIENNNVIVNHDDDYFALLRRIYDQLDHTVKQNDTKIHRPDVKKLGNKIMWCNFIPCCDSIGRQPQHLLSFVTVELATTAELGDKGLIVKGRYTNKQIEDLLKKYIVDYVTCNACRQMSTTFEKERGVQFKCCQQCGCKTSVPTLKIS